MPSVVNDKVYEYKELCEDNVPAQRFIANMIHENLERMKNLFPSAAKTGGPGDPVQGGATGAQGAHAMTSVVIRKARRNKNRRK